MAVAGYEVWADNASTVLANAISPTSGTINVQSGTGAKFPSITPGSTYFRIVITSAATPNSTIEVMIVTSVATDTFTVLRGQEGTTAQSWAVGDLVFNAFSAGGIANFTRITQVQNDYYVAGVDSGTANAYAVTMNVPFTSSTKFQELVFTATNTNTGASTVQIIGASTYSIIGMSGAALQGGEILSGSVVRLIYNGSAYVLQYASNGAFPVANGSQSHHAIAWGQQSSLNVNSALTASYATNAGNSTTTSQTDFTNLTIGSSQVLDAANFNTYAPTKTGTGASGTWGINISGNAATATNATTAATLNGNWTSLPAGTVMSFYQASAPAGWTQVTSVNDSAIRIVSGTGGSTGGSVNFSSAFVSQSVTGSITINTPTGTVGSTALSVDQLPPHNHSVSISDPSHSHGISDPGHHHGGWGEAYIGNWPFGIYAGPGYVGSHSTDTDNYIFNTSTNVTNIAVNGARTGITASCNYTGSGASHTHTLSMNSQSGFFSGNAINLAVKYINMILCSKN